MRTTDSSIPGEVDPDGNVTIQVASKRIARLVQLGVHVERAARLKQAHRRMVRESRRRNRSK
jgi:hypothetical protein